MINFENYMYKFNDIELNYFHSSSLKMMEDVAKPMPTPMSIDATNNSGDSSRKINPTPKPTSVVPPISNPLLSSFCPPIRQ